MNTTNFYNLKAVTKVVFAFCISLVMILSSCKDDNEAGGTFSLKDNPTKLEAVAGGASETYTVQASGNWKVEPLRKEHWVKIDPAEGNGNGTFTVTVNKNTDPESRALTLFFTVDGKLQNNVLKIEQAAASEQDQEKDPNLNIEGLAASLNLLEPGMTERYIVRATGKWKLEIDQDEEYPWLTISQLEGEGDTPITITVPKNTDITRAAEISLYLNEVRQPNSYVINQKGLPLQVSGDLVFKEDFSWLNYGSEILSTTTGETRIGTWTAAEIAKGWTSTINLTEGGGTYASMYARPGFVKLGRTSYGADIISPKLTNVQRKKNLVVTFKALRYATTDHYALTVGVTGPGTVSRSSFDIMNVPTANNNLDACRAAWQAPAATYSFVVTGATAETQVWFLGGAFDQRAGNWPSTVNRIFIDDVVVKVQ